MVSFSNLQFSRRNNIELREKPRSGQVFFGFYIDLYYFHKQDNEKKLWGEFRLFGQ